MGDGHPDIAKIGEATQFGKGQDPKTTGAKASTWSIRNMVRYFAANNIPLDDRDAIRRFLGKQPTVAQVIALKGLQKAMNGDMRAIEYSTEQVDGKLPVINVNTPKLPEEELSVDELRAFAASLDRAIAASAARTPKEET